MFLSIQERGYSYQLPVEVRYELSGVVDVASHFLVGGCEWGSHIVTSQRGEGGKLREREGERKGGRDKLIPINGYCMQY